MTFKILRIPLLYTLIVSILTVILKVHIMYNFLIILLTQYRNWFEHVLYLDEDEESNEAQGVG